jgi:hypothetical protein
MVNSSVWYRHWLEIRIGLTTSLIWSGLLCLLYPVFMLGGFNWFVTSGRITHELSVVAPRLAAMGSERFFSWGTHVWISAAAALFVGLFLGDTAIRTSGQPGMGSLYYTLTLPVSRFDLIWTRFATACAAAFGLLATMLVFDCAVLLVIGRSVPIGAMAASSFLAALLVPPVMAVFGLLIPLWGVKVLLPAVMVAGFAVVQWAWTPAMGFIASQSVPWNTIGLLLLIVGAALSTAAVVAQHKDF